MTHAAERHDERPDLTGVTIDGVLAQGSQGTIWRGRWSDGEVPVAVKALRCPERRGPRIAAQVLALTPIGHPALPSIRDVRYEPGWAFVLEDLVAGTSLARLTDARRLAGSAPVGTGLSGTGTGGGTGLGEGSGMGGGTGLGGIELGGIELGGIELAAALAEVADGLAQLHLRGLVHGAISARKILVAETSGRLVGLIRAVDGDGAHAWLLAPSRSAQARDDVGALIEAGLAATQPAADHAMGELGRLFGDARADGELTADELALLLRAFAAGSLPGAAALSEHPVGSSVANDGDGGMPLATEETVCPPTASDGLVGPPTSSGGPAGVSVRPDSFADPPMACDPVNPPPMALANDGPEMVPKQPATEPGQIELGSPVIAMLRGLEATGVRGLGEIGGLGGFGGVGALDGVAGQPSPSGAGSSIAAWRAVPTGTGGNDTGLDWPFRPEDRPLSWRARLRGSRRAQAGLVAAAGLVAGVVALAPILSARVDRTQPGESVSQRAGPSRPGPASSGGPSDSPAPTPSDGASPRALSPVGAPPDPASAVDPAGQADSTGSADSTAALSGAQADGGTSPSAAEIHAITASLSNARAQALSGGDETALAVALAANSPAWRADAALLKRLAQRGERIDGLQITVSDARRLGSCKSPAGAPAGLDCARAAVTSQTSAYTIRSSTGASRDVAAAAPETMHLDLVLIGDGWRVWNITAPAT